MKCPKCSSERNHVYKTHKKGVELTICYHKCSSCGHKFLSNEEVSPRKIWVKQYEHQLSLPNVLPIT